MTFLHSLIDADDAEPVPLPFVIAEGGVNHNGEVDLAHALIDAAAEAGANAVKFQTFDVDALVSIGAESAPYQVEHTGSADQRGMLAALSLPAGAWTELASHAREKKLVFMSTAFDPASADLVCALGVQVLKSPSGELTNLPFLADLASRGLPMIVSTGMSSLEEVSAAVGVCRRAPALALLHCVTAYPTPVEVSNLRAMSTMKESFDVPVGWSDHTDGLVTAIAAVALGAQILEKHLTTDRDLPGPDHRASADPTQFADYVRAVQGAARALGDGVKQPAAVERANMDAARRSWHAVESLNPGHVLRVEDVVALRPAVGISPATDIVGWTLAAEVRVGDPIRERDLVAPAS